MDFSVPASITPKAAAKLLISGEIDVEGTWSSKSASKVLDELQALPIDDILKIVDCNTYGEVADMHSIPQFGKLESIINVPSYFVDNGNCCADYPQLGFYLKQDVDASLVANTKFGENHGKAASILGIANCVHRRIIPSALTYCFTELEYTQKEEIIKRLLFRIPIVQIILCCAKFGKVNGYDSMSQLMDSTRRRRSQCLRAIFRILKDYNNADLSMRINNIVWEDE